MPIESLNPATEELIKKYEPFSDEEVTKIIDNVNSEYFSWKMTSFSERKKLLGNAANVLREEKHKYAEILTLEMGKPITEAIAEVEKCAWVCEYYAENSEVILKTKLLKPTPLKVISGLTQ